MQKSQSTQKFDAEQSIPPQSLIGEFMKAVSSETEERGATMSGQISEQILPTERNVTSAGNFSSILPKAAFSTWMQGKNI